MNATRTSNGHASHELRFTSLFHAGRALSFPCDEAGHVDIDSLSSRARLNYFYARSVIGRDFCAPAVQQPAVLH